MTLLKVGTENSTPIHLYYEDHGVGRPVVLIHGWPLSGRSWERQVPALIEGGYRVITYDRRGFGQSSRPATGYDASTLAGDLNALMTTLDLRDATLVGFSMGGAEVARYLGKFGSERVSKAVFVGAVTPYLLKTAANPDGVDGTVFDGIRKGVIADRPHFLNTFFKGFYNVGLFDHISEEALRMSWQIAVEASPIGTLKAIDAWLEDFRPELQALKIPVLVVHGDADKTVPPKASGARMEQVIPQCEYRPIAGAPHGLNWTHSVELNRILLDFLGRDVALRRPLEPQSDPTDGRR